MSYSYDFRTARFVFRDAYPDMDPGLAKLLQTASEASKQAHEAFGNAKYLSGRGTSDDWKDVVKLYDKAIKAWVAVETARADYTFNLTEGGSSKQETARDRARKTRRLCMDRQAEAKVAEKAAFEREREEEETWERSLRG